MVKTAKINPTVFFATRARLIGPEVKLTIEQSLPGNLSAEDWSMMREVIEAVRQALPNAADRRPGAVLEHVLDALRQAQARPIDSVENASNMDSSNGESAQMGVCRVHPILAHQLFYAQL
jgi:hypothetical protein